MRSREARMDFVFTRLESLKAMLSKIAGEVEMLREQNARLSEENDHLKKTNEELARRISALEMGLTGRELSQKLQGNSGSKEKASEQVNKMIKLIDHIITEVKNEWG